MVQTQTVSIVMAAGRGSRMRAYDGNKTLLPLVPGVSSFTGEEIILRRIIASLPPGPRAVVVHFKEEDVRAHTADMGVTYCRQAELNGTGGALLAARAFIENQDSPNVIITMGDVPFVRPATYAHLIDLLKRHHLVVLGFTPEDKKQYGVLETDRDQVAKITEWKYWKDYSTERQMALTVCNSGIYAVRRSQLVQYLPVLAERPQIVIKERAGQMVEIEEFFLTDIVEYMKADGLSIGYAVAADEMETMGVDDQSALKRAQLYFKTTVADA